MLSYERLHLGMSLPKRESFCQAVERSLLLYANGDWLVRAATEREAYKVRYRDHVQVVDLGRSFNLVLM